MRCPGCYGRSSLCGNPRFGETVVYKKEDYDRIIFDKNEYFFGDRIILLQTYVRIFHTEEIAFWSGMGLKKGTEDFPFPRFFSQEKIFHNTNPIVLSINQSLFDEIIVRTVCFVES